MTTETSKPRKTALTQMIEEPRKFFNLSKVAEASGVDRDKIYNNFKDKYRTLTYEEQKHIATIMMGPTVKLFEKLGMKVSFSPLE